MYDIYRRRILPYMATHHPLEPALQGVVWSVFSRTARPVGVDVVVIDLFFRERVDRVAVVQFHFYEEKLNHPYPL